MTRLFTAGHSTRSAAELIELLREAGVRLLVDVRRHPGSRRHPQFAQDALRDALAEGGIAYRHEPDLGGRRAPREDSPNTAWRNAGFRGYADHMSTASFRQALERLLAAAEEMGTAVLCAEALPSRCHRRLIADAAALRGLEVVHLLGPGQRAAHELHAAAGAREDGSVGYAAGPAQAALFAPAMRRKAAL